MATHVPGLPPETHRQPLGCPVTTAVFQTMSPWDQVPDVGAALPP